MLRAGNLFTNERRIEYAIRACIVIFNIGEESERVVAGHILLLHSYISGSVSVNIPCFLISFYALLLSFPSRIRILYTCSNSEKI